MEDSSVQMYVDISRNQKTRAFSNYIKHRSECAVCSVCGKFFVARLNCSCRNTRLHDYVYPEYFWERETYN